MMGELDQICHHFATKEVLCSIQAKIMPGEAIAIIGPNGGGKTTLLKIIAGLMEPTSGAIHWSEKMHAKGYVPQLWKVDRTFPLTLEELVLSATIGPSSLGPFYSKKERELAKEMLHQLRLDHCASLSLQVASGGQLQRALLARALLPNPSLLLLDEATSQIDPASTLLIEETIKNEVARGHTCLFVTHQLEQVRRLASRVWCVQRTLEEFAPEEICLHHGQGLFHSPHQGAHSIN